jgi:UDP-3-O-[3-hydroxymyristoyl] N-acetylglucosamine deacetylase
MSVEHLLAALTMVGIWDAKIQLKRGGEVPALDGSARDFIVAFLEASEEERLSRRRWRVARPFTHRQKRAECHLSPSTHLVVECTIDFSHPMIRRQHTRINNTSPLDRFIRARTFGLMDEAPALRCQGLARGANLANTLVFDNNRVLNPGGLRYSDEPVRHKTVDALGDLALLGRPLAGHVRLERPSHRLLLQALKRAMAAGVLESQNR